MPRKESEAVLEGNGPLPQDAGKMATWEESKRVVKETWGEALKEIKEDLLSMNQRVASLEQDTQQPHLVMEADGPVDTKTREHTEGAAKAVQAKYGDSCTAKRVQSGPKTSISFGVKAKPRVLPCKNDVIVENGAAAPNSYISALEMRTTTAACGLLRTSKTSTATKPPTTSHLFGSTRPERRV